MPYGRGSNFLKVQSSCIEDKELISLIAKFNISYNKFEMVLSVNSKILAENPDAKIETKSYWDENSSVESLIATMNKM